MLDDIVFGVLGPDDGYANPREVLRAFAARRRPPASSSSTTRSSASTSSGGRVRGVRLASGDTIATPTVVNAAGPWAGRRRRAGRPRSSRRADAADAVPRDAAAPVAASLSDGDRSRRRALAARRSGRRPAIPIASSSRSPSGTSRRRELRARSSRAGHESFFPRSSGGCPRSETLRDVEGWAGLYEMTPDHNPVLGEHPALAASSSPTASAVTG